MKKVKVRIESCFDLAYMLVPVLIWTEVEGLPGHGESMVERFKHRHLSPSEIRVIKDRCKKFNYPINEIRRKGIWLFTEKEIEKLIKGKEEE